jgi:hypothetical protein
MAEEGFDFAIVAMLLHIRTNSSRTENPESSPSEVLGSWEAYKQCATSFKNIL